MINNPISDMLIRIKNAYLARHRQTSMPYSKLKKSLGEILVKEGFIKESKVKDEGGLRNLALTLMYKDRRPALTDLEIISKPSLRIYVSKKKIPRVLGGLGICVLSTPKGLMTGDAALKKGLGGELLCKIW